MAEIPVEKKSSFSWIWILLGLLLLGLLAWWLLGDDEVDAVDDTEVAEVGSADDDIGNDAALAAGGAAVAALAIGDDVDLDNVRVTELLGDMSFRVDANGEPMVVLFDEVQTPDTATEGRYDINVGSLVNLEGEVRSASDPIPNGIDATLPSGTGRYIHATTIEMLD